MVTIRSGTGSLTIDALDFASLPEFWELIDGELIELSPASFGSSWLGGMLFRLLLQEGQDRGLGWAAPADAGFILFRDRQTVVSPDAAFVRRERMPDPNIIGFADLAPDFAIEVISPTDRLADARRKAELYIRAGTDLVWLVDPKRRQVTIYQQDAPPITRVGDAELTAAPVLPEMRVSLSDLFPEPLIPAQ